MSGFALKIIAIVCMVIDHAYKIAPEMIASFGDVKIPFLTGTVWLSGLIGLLGRISLPIFAFEIAEGCKYTKSFPKYLRRLFLFAVISELPFDYCLKGSFTLDSQNVMWTFLLGVLAVFIYEKLKPRTILGLLGVFICAAVSYVGRTDYRGMGVLLVFIIYISKNKPMKLLSMAVVLFIYYLFDRGLFWMIRDGNVVQIIDGSLRFCATLLSLPIIAFYNGKKGHSMKWFFYAFYPLHLIVLELVGRLWT